MTKTYFGANILKLTVIENGLKGGDGGHGGFVTIRLEELASGYLESFGECVSEVEFGVRGDCERIELTKALRDVVKYLNLTIDQSGVDEDIIDFSVVDE